MVVDKLGIDLIAHDPVVILTDENGKSSLPITIGVFEATAIALALEGTHIPRPISHDLIKTIIESLQGTLEKVVIFDVKDGTFYAKLVIVSDGEDIEIDARPSDSIAIALRMSAPIYAAEHVLESDGIRGIEIIDDEPPEFDDDGSLDDEDTDNDEDDDSEEDDEDDDSVEELDDDECSCAHSATKQATSNKCSLMDQSDDAYRTFIDSLTPSDFADGFPASDKEQDSSASDSPSDEKNPHDGDAQE